MRASGVAESARGGKGRAGGLARRCPAARASGVAEPARKRSRAGGLARRGPAVRASGVAESAREKRSCWRDGEKVPRSTCFRGRRVGPGEEAALAGWRGGAPQRALPGSLSRPGIRGRAGGMARRCPAARDFGVAEPARKRSRAGGLARRCPAARASGVAESARKKFRKRSRWRDGEKLSCSACFRYGPGVETSEEGVLAGWREAAP